MIRHSRENTAREERQADTEGEREGETVQRKPDVLEKISEWCGGGGRGNRDRERMGEGERRDREAEGWIERMGRERVQEKEGEK